MSKKFILSLAILAFLGGSNIAIGKGPGAEEWKDNSSHLAPAKVRKAADNLWDAVEREGGAAFDAGWGMREALPCGPRRVCGGVFSCGLTELCIGYEVSDEFCFTGVVGYQANNMVYEQRTKDVKTALEEFKEAVNQSVLKPESYSGDANVCQLGSWIKDNSWRQEGIGNHMRVSARRDLSNITKSTKSFVTSHGGWISE